MKTYLRRGICKACGEPDELLRVRWICLRCAYPALHRKAEQLSKEQRK